MDGMKRWAKQKQTSMLEKNFIFVVPTIEIWKIIKIINKFSYHKISTWKYLKSGIINENIQFESTKFIFNKLGSSYYYY